MLNIPYGKQNVDDHDLDAVIEVLKSDWLTQGPKVHEFEEKVAALHQCKYAVAFSNGTAALHGAYYVSTKFPFGRKGNTIADLNQIISKRDNAEYTDLKNLYWEFITTPVTFIASANAGLYCGGAPRFVDLDLTTYCIDIEKIEDSITDNTRVITPVSYAGYPVDIQAISRLPKVRDNNICIIHDACHAIGARRNHYNIADYADMTVLSFHPVKHITTGEGGMVLTNNENYYKKLLLFRNHGITRDRAQLVNEPDGKWYYEMQELGYNYRISDLQCALGVSQMRRLEENLFNRNAIANIYEDELKDLEWLRLPPGFNKEFAKGTMTPNALGEMENLHSYHLFVILLKEGALRKEFYDYMHSNGIYVQIHYIPIQRQPYYACEGKSLNLHESSYFYDRCVSLPMFSSLTQGELNYIINMIRNFKRE